MRLLGSSVSAIVIFLFMARLNTSISAEPQVPCYFVFGDSLSDCGNNNDLNTVSKANYSPYGIDFNGGIATGRFSNGRNFVDVLTELLGIEDYIPPFANLTGRNISKGVNYASGSAGILRETAKLLGARISLGEQIENHETIVGRLDQSLNSSASEHLNKCLYTVFIGNNDYINNYYMDGYSSSNLYTPTEFASLLIRHYAGHMQDLYKLGARKVALFGLGDIGCTLGEIVKFNESACVEFIVNATTTFNNKLSSLVDKLNDKFVDAQFTFINTTATTFTASEGFTVSASPCCPTRSDGQCKENSTPCANRSEYIFWDLYHPTEAGDVLYANHAYISNDSYGAHPMDISQLVSQNIQNMWQSY